MIKQNLAWIVKDIEDKKNELKEKAKQKREELRRRNTQELNEKQQIQKEILKAFRRFWINFFWQNVIDWLFPHINKNITLKNIVWFNDNFIPEEWKIGTKTIFDFKKVICKVYNVTTEWELNFPLVLRWDNLFLDETWEGTLQSIDYNKLNLKTKTKLGLIPIEKIKANFQKVLNNQNKNK
jgi:hypothetical protein